MKIELGRSEIRSWTSSDLESLVEHANNRNVWINRRDQFPYPYTPRDGRAFIKYARKASPETVFAIAVGGVAVGGAGFQPQRDIERVSAEIGYWLGEPFWG